MHFQARMPWHLYAKFASKFFRIFARNSSVAKVRRRETVMAGEGGGQETCFSQHYPLSHCYKLLTLVTLDQLRRKMNSFNPILQNGLGIVFNMSC
jgi:hypothetical protein